MNKLFLKTNFHEYYDHVFDNNYGGEDGYIFERFNNSGMNRIEMFKYLSSLGFLVPEHGILTNETPPYDLEKIVIYNDVKAHAGEGKVIVEKNNYENYLGKFYSKYIVTGDISSYRYLSLGTCNFWLKYSSNDCFRSNVGDVVIDLLDYDWAWAKFDSTCLCGEIENYPMFAVDFVEDFETEKIYAIDFNIAPGVNRTPIQDILSPTKIYKYLLEWFKTNHPGIN